MTILSGCKKSGLARCRTRKDAYGVEDTGSPGDASES